jgi:predicted nucleotide-binding protein (sugar kinase/HSP70/actin superfamily)
MVEPSRGGRGLKGCVLYIPRMSDEGPRLMAAAFRSLGVDARVSPPSTARTRELAARHLSGEECYPAHVTLGNFLRVLEDPDCDPERTCFFLPNAEGPCRFGQYAQLFRKIFRDLGRPEVRVISPSSRYGYEELRELDTAFERRAWRALVASDILRKLRLMNRPYEIEPGAVDRIIDAGLEACARVLADPELSRGPLLRDLVAALTGVRDRLRALPRTKGERPLIGVVGEIFCRLNEFSNEHVVRRIERLGGEAWLADITEWVHYTRVMRRELLAEQGRRLSGQALKMLLAERVQTADESVLLAPFREDFAEREEPHDLRRFLEAADPYLPFRGSLGEMVLSVAKVLWLHERGADGVVDVSPFTCMNGIISEAVYPRLSRDLGGLPIRSLYFDGTEADLDRDLGMFLEMAWSQRRRRAAAASA